MSAPPVALDLQACQSAKHAERGIARYVAEHAAAIERRAPGLVDHFLLNPRGLLPGPVERLMPTGRVAWATPERFERLHGPLLFHACSPFEMAIPLSEIWPAELRRHDVRLVVTLYDLIPLVYRDHYLREPSTRARYLARLQMIRSADRVLAISEASARDAERLLGIDRSRLRVIGTGVSDGFRPPTRPLDDLHASLRARFPALRPGYLLYTGGIDFRKNLERLIRAYARVPADLRQAHQLVITCRALPDEEAALRRLAAEVGVHDRVVLTNYVPDEVLRTLYQAARAFVFPSLYEGFGLPVAEAMRCGAPVIAADSSSLPEIVTDPEARFDPTDEEAIARSLVRAMTDDEFLERLRRHSAAARFPWDRVADATIEVYREPWRPRRARRATPRVAVVTPWPPQLSGIARYSQRLVAEMARHVRVDVFVDGDPSGYDPAPAGCEIHPARALSRRHQLLRYDRVLHCMGNSAFNDFVLEAMRTVPGDVLAHDARLARYYEWRRWEEGGQLADALREMYGDRVPEEALTQVPLHPADASRLGIWMTGEMSRLARRVLVHSRLAAEAVRLEAEAAGVRAEPVVVPFAFPDPVADPAGRPPVRNPTPRIVSFGVVDAVKCVDAIVEAMPAILARHPGARLAFVGPVQPWEARRVGAVVRSAGVASAVTLTGAVSEAGYATWLRLADVAIQLREVAGGEASATVTETMANGIPTVVSGLGWMAELPDDAVVKLPGAGSAADIAAAVNGLLDRAWEARRIGLAAAHLAQARSFRRTAEDLLDVLLGPSREAEAAALELAAR